MPDSLLLIRCAFIIIRYDRHLAPSLAKANDRTRTGGFIRSACGASCGAVYPYSVSLIDLPVRPLVNREMKSCVSVGP